MKYPKRIRYRGGVYTRIADEESTSRKPQSWPVYPSEEMQEKEQIENVFGLGGGELEEGNFAGFAYWYEGAPEYASESDLGIHPHEGELRTTITYGGGYLPHPAKELEHDGEMWELVKHFMSSGEADCWICGHGGNGKEWWADEFEDKHDRPPEPTDYCGLCETEYKDMPGYVFINSGYEAVYRLPPEEDADEDEDE